MRQREGDQPLPTKNDRPSVQSMVIKDMQDRERLGILRYGTALQPYNGRDALRDLYEELLDGAMYVRQEMAERDESPLYDAAEEWRRVVAICKVSPEARAALKIISDELGKAMAG